MNCSQCNSPLTQGVKFCFNCGQAVSGNDGDSSELVKSKPQASEHTQIDVPSDPLIGKTPLPADPDVAGSPRSVTGSSSSNTDYDPSLPGADTSDSKVATRSRSRWGTVLTGPAMGTVIIPLLAICAVLGAFLVAVNVGDMDWGDGAKVAAITAFICAAISLLLLIVWKNMGYSTRSRFVINLAMVVILVLSGFGGFVFTIPIQMLQARHYASIQDWKSVLQEYARISSDPRCGRECQNTVTSGVGQAHYEYGLQLAVQHDYEDAITQFEAAQTAAPAGPYAEQARSEDAQMHYEYGLQLAVQRYYARAITQFEAAQTAAPAGPYAEQAYLAAATAYYGLAKQQMLGPSCSDAVATLKMIVSNYADTPVASQAKADLVAPVTVTGVITNFPTNPTPQVWLSKKAHAPQCCKPASPGTYSFSGDYKTSLDPTFGTYIFALVRPGRYTVSLYRRVGSHWSYSWWYESNNIDLLFLQVGPVCPVTWTTLPCGSSCTA